MPANFGIIHLRIDDRPTLHRKQTIASNISINLVPKIKQLLVDSDVESLYANDFPIVAGGLATDLVRVQEKFLDALSQLINSTEVRV